MIKIIVLHWHGVCPHCRKPSCIYANFDRDEDGVKMPNGFECGTCGAWISEEDFDQIEKLDVPCPEEVIAKK